MVHGIVHEDVAEDSVALPYVMQCNEPGIIEWIAGELLTEVSVSGTISGRFEERRGLLYGVLEHLQGVF
jgi:hypothetical protein